MDNKVGESLQILEELWSEQNTIPSTEALLNMYDLQAKFYFKMQLYDKAISFTKEGIERARIDKMYDRSYELWTTLGGCYIKKKQLDEAQRCFRTALNLEKYIRRDYLIVTSQTQLGLLYLKQKNVVKAKELLEEAVRLGRKCNDVHRLNEALVGLGDCYLAEPNYKKARQCFEEALSLTKKQNDFDKKEDSILIKLLVCTNKDSKDYQDYEKRFIQIHMNKLDLHLPQGGEVNMRPDLQTNSIKINSADPPDA
ncbi:tetratricopeptide repeat protein [Laceyella tengchongensis]|uniref:tetratricopeptide repeat protein n=1 Tax=Laceyella tengchongensis TaxID=574699 RepID=UPI00188DCEAE